MFDTLGASLLQPDVNAKKQGCKISIRGEFKNFILADFLRSQCVTMTNIMNMNDNYLFNEINFNNEIKTINLPTI